MSFLGGIFGGKKVAAVAGDAVEGALKGVGDVIDGLTTSDEEKLSAKQAITATVLNALEKVAGHQKEVILAEAGGNSLQRNWRPILMLMFGGIIAITYVLFPVLNMFLHNAELQALIIDLKTNADFWGLLKLGIGGYVAGRSLEKISETVTQNVDMTFLKRKDRKDELKKD